MRVWITGAGGFVGTRLRARLEARDAYVHGTDLDVDIVDPEAVERTVAEQRPDAVVHLAAQSSVAASWKDAFGCFRTNYLGSRNLLRAVERRAPAARVLLVGSADVYDTCDVAAPPYREDAPLRPRSPYARSKAAAEQLGALAAERGLAAVRTRSFNHTGAGQSDAFVASSFARQVAAIELGRAAPRMHVGNLASVRDFLDVEDVIDAYLALLDPAVPVATYNVASGRGVPVRELLESLCQLAGVQPEVRTDPDRLRPTDGLVGDASRLRGATGWRPTRPLDETLAGLLEHWRAVLRADRAAPSGPYST